MRVIRIALRPLNVSVERENLYTRVKHLLEKAEFIANNYDNVKIRLKAMEIIVRIAQFLAGILKDLQLDEIEAELNRLESEEI